MTPGVLIYRGLKALLPERLNFVIQTLRKALKPWLHSSHLAVARRLRRLLRPRNVVRWRRWLVTVVVTTVATTRMAWLFLFF